MDHLLEPDFLPSAGPWLSQTSEPVTPATNPLPEDAGSDEAHIQPHHTPTDIAVHRLPMEIWIAVCDALRRLDLIDITIPHKAWPKDYPELRCKTTNKNRPDPIITAVSILQLSRTCRYLHKVALPSLLETIRFAMPLYGDGGEDRCYRSVIRQVKSLQLNSDQRLQHVTGFALVASAGFKVEPTGYGRVLHQEICHLLPRFPNLRHLTIIGMVLDAPLRQKILTLPLEHLWLWNIAPCYQPVDHTFIPTITPKVNLRSLMLREQSMATESSIPMTWIKHLIGTALQDLSFDSNELVPPVLPLLPDLEFLEGPGHWRVFGINPNVLHGLLSKTPNLKEVVFACEAAQEYPSNTIPALSCLERVVCHASWIRFLVPGRPITAAEAYCESPVRVQELLEFLHKSSVPLRDLTLTYAFIGQRLTWSPDDLEPLARYLPELEILRLMIYDHKTEGLEKGFPYISQLQKLRILKFSSWARQPCRFDAIHGGPLDDAWQESILREFLGLTKSRVLERVGFGEECEWKSGDTGAWILWGRGKMIRSVSL